MALSRNKARAYQEDNANGLPMAAGVTIFEGAAVGVDGAGHARPLTSGTRFAGFAAAAAVNGGSAGAATVRVRSSGQVELVVQGATGPADYNAPVYALDDDTFTLTAAAIVVGRVKRHVSGSQVVVQFEVDASPPGAEGVSYVAAASLTTLSGRAGEVREITDGPWRGYRVRWGVPEGETQPAWCHDAFPHRFP